jgi:hypothetical protein
MGLTGEHVDPLSIGQFDRGIRETVDVSLVRRDSA